MRIACPECGTALEATTEAAAALVVACVDHPAPNVKELEKRQGRCVEVGPYGRCELDDMHRSHHKVGDKEWKRFNKWNPWHREIEGYD